MVPMAHLVEIFPALYGTVVYIARHMREHDAEEIYPHIWNPTAENLAALSCQSNLKFVALSDGRPVAAWGAAERLPQVWNCWMFATDNWMQVALPVTRHIIKVVRPAVIDAGAVRLDCWSMEGHDVAHRWLEMLGAIREASLEDYGSNRKTYHNYSWTLSRLENEKKCASANPPNLK
jgi:hypothetical protein